MKQREIDAAWQAPRQCELCGIRHLVLFADLDSDDFQLIHKPIDVLSYSAGAVLYRTSDAPEYLFTIRQGLLKLVQYLPNGGQRIVRVLEQGDVAGLELLLGQPYQHDVVVLEPTDVCRIPVAVVDRLSRDTPRLHRQLLKRWQRAVNEADAWLTDLSTGSARSRVARLLLRLAEIGSADRFYLPSREDIGAMVGITTETASRSIAEFKRAGVIRELDAKHAALDEFEMKGFSEK